jgi:hypothetical protein
MNTLQISDVFEPYYVGRKSLLKPTRLPPENPGPFSEAASPGEQEAAFGDETAPRRSPERASRS